MWTQSLTDKNTALKSLPEYMAIMVLTFSFKGFSKMNKDIDVQCNGIRPIISALPLCLLQRIPISNLCPGETELTVPVVTWNTYSQKTFLALATCTLLCSVLHVQQEQFWTFLMAPRTVPSAWRTKEKNIEQHIISSLNDCVK